ncbi:MAG: hypothetical protein J0H09_02225 [Burkholderiales bacterium]|nr:hypothetical protein [Burkholderiales bacterium]
MTTSFPAAAAIEAEQLFRDTHAKIVEGRNCDPDALLRAVTRAAALDGQRIAPSTSLHQGLRRLQKLLEQGARS